MLAHQPPTSPWGDPSISSLIASGEEPRSAEVKPHSDRWTDAPGAAVAPVPGRPSGCCNCGHPCWLHGKARHEHSSPVGRVGVGGQAVTAHAHMGCTHRISSSGAHVQVPPGQRARRTVHTWLFRTHVFREQTCTQRLTRPQLTAAHRTHTHGVTGLGTCVHVCTRTHTQSHLVVESADVQGRVP